MATPGRPNAKADRARKVDEMTDQEAAAFYYTHRTEPEGATESVNLDTPKRLSRVVSIRFDPDEAALIEQRAKNAGLTMSAYVRQAALGRSAMLQSDLTAMEDLVEMLMEVVQKTRLPKLLDTVADDVAHIRDKIGA